MNTSMSSTAASKPTYIHPCMKEVLEETYGVMVYQEQVMRILNRLGGIELSKAYACIKAISKKKTEFIAAEPRQFVAGAVERGLEEEQAEKIFDLIEFFGGYGFNKSHSTAYALVAYQTAYLKAHYPDRVHGRPALVRDGRGRARQVLRRTYRRLPADGHRGAAADINAGRGVLPGRHRGEDPLRPGGDQGGGIQGRRCDRRGAEAGGAVSEPGRLLRAGVALRGRPVLRRGPDQGRGVRLPGGPAGQLLAVLPGRSRPGRPSKTIAAAASAVLDVLETASQPGPGGTARPGNGNGPPTAMPTCPTCPSFPTPSCWPRRRRCSAFTCRATPSRGMHACCWRWRPTGSPSWRACPRRPRSSWAA